MIRHFLISIIFINIFFCKGQKCETLNKTFTSYAEAYRIIEKTHFNYTDQIITDKSSWIKNAKFFSCNMKYGYFIIGTSKKDYIFTNLPIKVWNDFKNAGSFGRFYNSYIRGRYKLITRN